MPRRASTVRDNFVETRTTTSPPPPRRYLAWRCRPAGSNFLFDTVENVTRSRPTRPRKCTVVEAAPANRRRYRRPRVSRQTPRTNRCNSISRLTLEFRSRRWSRVPRQALTGLRDSSLRRSGRLAFRLLYRQVVLAETLTVLLFHA